MRPGQTGGWSSGVAGSGRADVRRDLGGLGVGGQLSSRTAKAGLHMTAEQTGAGAKSLREISWKRSLA